MTRLLTATFLAAALVLGWPPGISADDEPSRAPITGVHAFGDSLTDNGNFFALSGGLNPPSPPYFDGRFSDGPVWIEKLVLLLEAILDDDVNLDDLAVAGARTDLDGVSLPGTGILGQIAEFEAEGRIERDEEYEAEGRIEHDEEYEAEGRIEHDELIVIWGGANNFFFDPTSTPETVVSDLEEAVARLADLGGRLFLVPNLPNLGETPLGVSRGPGAQALLNGQTQGHNARLAEVMAELSDELKVEILVLDINSLFKGLFVTFENVTNPCLILEDAIPDPTGACGDEISALDTTGTLFWDQVHPTAAAHNLIAFFAYGALVGAGAHDD